MIKKIFILVFFGLLVSVNSFAQGVSAKVNRTELPEGETFLLTLDYEGINGQIKPGLDVLEKDFNIYSVSNSYKTEILNSKVSQFMQWNIVLMPKNIGVLQVPEISLGNSKTAPIAIKVVDADNQVVLPKSTSKQINKNYKMTGDVDNKRPFVQQQIIYTLELQDAGDLQGSEPVFELKNKEDWIVEKLNEPIIETKQVDGKTVRDIKFIYALFPQKSGELEVPRVLFNGYYLTKSRRVDPFADMLGNDLSGMGFGMMDIFANKVPVNLKVNPITISVLSMPADYNAKWWLPAKSVKLDAKFSDKVAKFEVGQAISRSVYVQAVGVMATQLPDINFAEVDGMKVYPSQPEVKSYSSGDDVVSVKKVDVVYIPETSGQNSLPAISLDWFDVGTSSFKTASIPAVKINVKASADVENDIVEPVKQEVKADVENVVAKIDVAQNKSNNSNNLHLVIIVIVAFVFGVFISYFLLKPKSNKKTNYKKQVISKAKSKDYRGLRDAIIVWAKYFYKEQNINNLKEVMLLTNNKEFYAQLELLNKELYSKQNINWNEKEFIIIFEKITKKNKKQDKQEKILPDLYK